MTNEASDRGQLVSGRAPPQVRRAALDALASLGAEAEPAAGAIVASLADESWQAPKRQKAVESDKCCQKRQMLANATNAT